MSYNTGTCLKKKNAVRKILISLFISILFISAFSVIAFAQETQPVHNEENEAKYVSTKQVNRVFRKLSDFVELPESETITKSNLYESLSSECKSNLPTRIILDLEINSEDMITEDDLIMYLEEIEEESTKGYCNVAIWVFLLLMLVMVSILAYIAGYCHESILSRINYGKKLDNLKESLDSIKDKMKYK